MRFIAKTAIIHSGVVLPEKIIIEDYCIIGAPIYGREKLETIIGDGAIIRSHTVIYAGNIIGKNFQTGNKANIREENVIGDNVSVGTHSIIEHHVIIEDNVRIHSSAFVPEYTVLKNGSWIGPHVVLTNAKYPLAPDAKKNLKGPIIHKKAKIGANSTVLPGVEVAADSLVGAGSVVTKNILENHIAYGNPAITKETK